MINTTLKKIVFTNILVTFIASTGVAQQQNGAVQSQIQTHPKGQQGSNYQGKPGSTPQYQAPQIQGQGSQYHGHGSQNQGQGSQYHGHGSQNQGHGSQNQGQSSPYHGHGLQNQGQGSQYHGHGSQYYGHGFKGWRHNGRWWGRHSGNWEGVYWLPNIFFYRRGQECIKSCYKDRSGRYCNVKCY